MAWVRRGGWVCFTAVVWVGCYEASSSGDRSEDGGAGSSEDAGTGGKGTPQAGAGGSGGVSGGVSSGGSAGGGATGGASAEAGRPGAGGTAPGGSGEGGLSEGGAPSAAGGSGFAGEGSAVGGSGGVDSGGASGAPGASGEGGVSGTIGGGGDGGSGCTGALEEVVNGLCVATMATLPSEDGDYRIDRTEVTRGQYQSWLATNPSPLPVVITACAYNESYDPYEPCAHAEGPGADRHPITCVDWCDARFYCAAVGKRLCGTTDGSPLPFELDATDWHRDQWAIACTADGDQIFTYDEPYDASACNTESSATVPVASLATCQSAVATYAGIYDLNGNVREWVDQCRPDNSSPDCHTRGGGFDEGLFACGNPGLAQRRQTVYPNLGFRCCSR